MIFQYRRQFNLAHAGAGFVKRRPQCVLGDLNGSAKGGDFPGILDHAQFFQCPGGIDHCGVRRGGANRFAFEKAHEQALDADGLARRLQRAKRVAEGALVSVRVAVGKQTRLYRVSLEKRNLQFGDDGSWLGLKGQEYDDGAFHDKVYRVEEVAVVGSWDQRDYVQPGLPHDRVEFVKTDLVNHQEMTSRAEAATGLG